MIGYVYSIELKDNSNICYVSSTTERISNIMINYEEKFKKWMLGDLISSSVIYKYFKRFGFKKFELRVLKSYKIIDEEHLNVFEALWIIKKKPFNKESPFIKHLKNCLEIIKLAHLADIEATIANATTEDNLEDTTTEDNLEDNEVIIANTEVDTESDSEDIESKKRKIQDNYICYPCEYSTKSKGDYKKHTLAKKHKKNVNGRYLEYDY